MSKVKSKKRVIFFFIFPYIEKKSSYVHFPGILLNKSGLWLYILCETKCSQFLLAATCLQPAAPPQLSTRLKMRRRFVIRCTCVELRIALSISLPPSHALSFTRLWLFFSLRKAKKKKHSIFRLLVALIAIAGAEISLELALRVGGWCHLFRSMEEILL